MEPELMHKPIKNPNLKSTQNYIESRSSEKKQTIKVRLIEQCKTSKY